MKALATSLFATTALHLFAQASFAAEVLEEVIITNEASSHHEGLTEDSHTLNQDMISRQTADTLGELLINTPGVANASFGQGVGRPMLRGLAGTQVGIFSNGIQVQDVSASSPDHATMVDPSDASRIEIIHGPEALFYGGGYSGGVINIVKHHIHESPLPKNQGSLSTALSSNNQGKQVKGNLDLGMDNWILHLEGFGRKNEDYTSGKGKISNSDNKGAGGNIALSYADNDRGFIGASVSQLDYDYAVPNPHNHDLRIKPKSTDVNVRSEYRFTDSPISSWSNILAYTDYSHKEFEDGEAEAYFKKQSAQIKSWFDHEIIDGMTGSIGMDIEYQSNALCHSHDGCDRIPRYNQPWNGSKGDHFHTEDGYDFSHGTPMPETKTTDYGLFLIETLPWAQGTIRAGLRGGYRQITSNPVNIELDNRQSRHYYTDKDFSTLNASVQGAWQLNDSNTLNLTLSHNERAPEAEELFYNGEHHATSSYQLDNPNLDTEKSNTINIAWHLNHDRIATTFSLFYTDFDSFIYNARLPFTDPDHGNPVYRHAQAGATFTGAEFSIDTKPFEQFSAFGLNFFADIVRAQLKEGTNKNLPRIPPASLGLAAVYQTDNLLLQSDIRSYLAQDNVADNETKTPRYSTFNLQGRYDQKLGKYTGWLALKGNNLTNQYGENAVSYLKRYAPVMGRNIVFEVGIKF